MHSGPSVRVPNLITIFTYCHMVCSCCEYYAKALKRSSAKTNKPPRMRGGFVVLIWLKICNIANRFDYTILRVWLSSVRRMLCRSAFSRITNPGALPTSIDPSLESRPMAIAPFSVAQVSNSFSGTSPKSSMLPTIDRWRAEAKESVPIAMRELELRSSSTGGLLFDI